MRPFWTANNALAYDHLSDRLARLGRGKEALPLAKKAIRLNPVAPWWYFAHLGHAHWVIGQYEEPLAAYKETKHRSPNLHAIRVWLAETYSLLGREEEARAEATEVLRLKPDFSVDGYMKRFFGSRIKDQAYPERVANALHKAGLK